MKYPKLPGQIRNEPDPLKNYLIAFVGRPVHEVEILMGIYLGMAQVLSALGPEVAEQWAPANGLGDWPPCSAAHGPGSGRCRSQLRRWAVIPQSLEVMSFNYTRCPMTFRQAHTAHHGIGIPAGHLERIWRIFERVHSQDQYPGTGIGLSIVKRATEKMGGSAGVASEPGEGSTFWLELAKA